MKAAICTAYGSPEVIQIKEVKKPQVKEDEILIKIQASSLSSGDARMRRADPFLIRLIFGFQRPRNPVLGVVVAGEIEAVGTKVRKFKVGDRVFGTTGISFGAHAQYQAISENSTLAIIPEGMTYAEAAAIPFGGTAALHFLKKAEVKPGDKVLIYGASGAIGTIALQVAKYYGAEVTAVCSGRNAALVHDLGADKVIDYTKEDFSSSVEKYDVIFETVGKSSFRSGIKALKKGGKILLAAAGFKLMFGASLYSVFSDKKVVAGVVEESAQDLEFLKELIKSGHLQTVTDKIYPLRDIRKAHAYVDTGRKRGNVILDISEN